MKKEISMKMFVEDKKHLDKVPSSVLNKFEDYFKFSRYKGSKYKLPLNAFLTQIFRLNEEAMPEFRWTDAQIAVKVQREYRGFDSLLKSWQPENYEKKILDQRHRYNRGNLIASTPHLPEKLSYRYDRKGKIICAKFSKKNFEESVKEWVLKQECKYSALAYFNMDKGVYTDDLERDWFQPEDHPYVVEELKQIRHKAKEAHKRQKAGTLRRPKKNV